MKQSLTVYLIIIIYTILALVCIVDARADATIKYSDLQIIFEAADKYKLNADRLVRIAYVESRFKHDAIRQNKNGTIDIGYFQINSIHWHTTCKEYDVTQFKGNAMCAAKLLAMHKLSASHKDKLWPSRYHSKTPSKKAAYARKLASVPAIKIR